jgi:hypothetical protein
MATYSKGANGAFSGKVGRVNWQKLAQHRLLEGAVQKELQTQY